MHRKLIGVLLCCLGGASLLWAQPVPEGGEFQVNTYTTNSQTYPVVGTDDSGNFVVVWHSSVQDSSLLGVFGQRYNADGTPNGGEFQVNTFFVLDQSFPDLAVNGSGDFIIVWQSLGDGAATGIFAQRYNDDGTTNGGEFQVNTFTTYAQGRPAVALEDGGAFVVVWQSNYQDTSGDGIFGQRFRANGTTNGGEFQVHSFTTGYQAFPDVALDGGGRFVVVWQSDGQDGSYYGVFGQRYAANGNPDGGEFPVNSFTPGDQNRPSLDVNDPGAFVVAWQSNDQDGSVFGIFGQQFDSTGMTMGPEFQANSNAGSDQIRPDVSVDGSGNFGIIWESEVQDGNSFGVFGQMFLDTGTPVGAEFQVNTFTTSGQQYPSVSLQDSGDMVVVWASQNQDGSNNGVFGQRYTDAISCVPQPGPISDLSLVETPPGSLLFTWTDTVNSDDYVVFQDTQPDGTFSTQVGTALTGATGLSIPMPATNLLYFIVSGRNAACGVGP